MKIRKNDEVKIMAGKDNGKIGKVLNVLAKEGKVLVENVNQYKKHKKGQAKGEKSEIITLTKPLPLANVMIVCPKCHKTSRLGYRMDNETKVRFCKKCQATI